MTRLNPCCSVAAATMLAALLLAAAPAAGQSAATTFTYQGELSLGGQPADGAFDFGFSLFDAQGTGNQVGTTQTLLGVPVAGGRFTVELDFGGGAFDGAARWFEIAVDGSTLSPRQAVTPAPYSITTRGLFVDDTGNVTFNSLVAVSGEVRMTSIGGIDLVIDADTNNVGESQNARLRLRQDGGRSPRGWG